MSRKNSRGTSEEMKEFYRKTFRAYYPDSANASDRYIYLSSLSRDNPSLNSAATALLKVNGNIKDNFMQEAHFDEALKFLQSAANNERQKEINFLRSRGFEVDLDNTNFLDLIKQINEAIIGQDELARRVNEEINRRGVRGQGSHSYTQSMGSYIKSALNQMTGASKSRNTIPGVIRSSLITMIGKHLQGNLEIDQIATIIGSFQSQIMKEITDIVAADKRNPKNGVIADFLNKDGETINQKKIENLIRKTKIYQNNFGPQAKKNIDELKQYANNITSKFNLVLSKEARDRIKKTFSELPRLKDNKIDWKAIAQDKNIMSTLSDMTPEEMYTYSFERNTGMGGEGRVYQDLKDIIVNYLNWSGGTGGKIDVTTFKLGNVVIKDKNSRRKLQQALDKMANNITQKTQSEFEKTGQGMIEAYEEIEKILADSQKELGELQQSFIIHSNVKDYYTTSQPDKFSGFLGGNWGVIDLVNSLSALSGIGFSGADTDWLATCLINTAQASIGASNIDSLEKYISIFASMLLFDDGVAIAKNVGENVDKSNLNVLHLFPVNGIYVPSSYIMSAVVNHFTMIGDTLIGKSDQTIDVHINPGSINFSNFLESLPTQGPQRWRETADAQIDAMSIRIKFLANFMDFIDSFGI